MKVWIDDLDALGALRPLDLAAYLRSRGWTEPDPSGSTPLSAWEKAFEGTTVELLAPRNQGWPDYARRVRAAIATLSDVERRSQLAVLRDISEIVVDVVRLRAVNGRASVGTIPLMDGLYLVSAARGLLLSAACSAIKPKRAYHTRKPAQAIKYVEGLRLGQSERGSYVLTVLSPVSPALTSLQLDHPYAGAAPTTSVDDEPFERRVTRTLGVALDQLDRAARRGAASGELTAFEDAIPMGKPSSPRGSASRPASPRGCGIGEARRAGIRRAGRRLSV